MNSRLSNTFCIPSLSGTFGIPAKLALIPKMPKEPSSPSRSNARIERQSSNERIDADMNQGQRTIYRSLSGRNDPAMTLG
jgi:hypothetical protein